MNQEKMNKENDYSLPATVFIVFLILKLTHLIDWSWWWITSPLWIPITLAAIFGLILGIIVWIDEKIY